MTAAATPALRVAMIGYAFMGAAHSQAWRTAGHVAELPLRPELAVVREEFFGKKGPASTLVQIAGLAFPYLLVEIEAVALL